MNSRKRRYSDCRFEPRDRHARRQEGHSCSAVQKSVVVFGGPVCLARQCVRATAVGVHPAVNVLFGTVSRWLPFDSTYICCSGSQARGACRQVQYGMASLVLSVSRQVDLVYERAVEGTGAKVASRERKYEVRKRSRKQSRARPGRECGVKTTGQLRVALFLF